MRALLVYAAPCYIGHDNLFLIDGTSCDDFAVRSANEALSPKFNTFATRRRFMADAVWHRDIAAIRDCVTALDRFPGGMLRCAELLLFRRVPADCCWIKNNLCAVQRRQARRFRIPLVPANADADLTLGCWPRLKSKIAWRGSSGICIFRYLPSNVPFASMIAAVL